jgi:hypothetical protein
VLHPFPSGCTRAVFVHPHGRDEERSQLGFKIGIALFAPSHAPNFL